MPPADAAARFHHLLETAVAGGSLLKLTLGKPRPAASDPTLRNVFVRPVALRAGPRLAFVFRHATRDVTQNLAPAEALAAIAGLLERDFYDAHLFTPLFTAQFEQRPDGTARLRQKQCDAAPPAPPAGNDRVKHRLFAPDAPWLRALGVTNAQGQPREGMAHKLRQIEKFAELLRALLDEAGLDSGDEQAAPLRIADMGAGKGYLTFALAALLGPRARITGVERRGDLVELANRVSAECSFSGHLNFVEGSIPTPEAGRDDALAGLDVLIALHACDTATDDALAAGHAAGARLLVVSPCCQKELRPQLTAPPVLADALRHGIFQERQAEFVTDALRAQLLECAGYRSKVFEFVSTEHTAKNLLIAAHRPRATSGPLLEAPLARARAFATFYGIRHHRLARHLGIEL
ncbi:MAG: SAM-dependent methyltransferase, partial [Opitutaceae bacterium]|nr:SAM-dependent methyltransferase [Opitutaceae bacterium]